MKNSKGESDRYIERKGKTINIFCLNQNVSVNNKDFIDNSLQTTDTFSNLLELLISLKIR